MGLAQQGPRLGRAGQAVVTWRPALLGQGLVALVAWHGVLGCGQGVPGSDGEACWSPHSLDANFSLNTVLQPWFTFSFFVL